MTELGKQLKEEAGERIEHSKSVKAYADPIGCALIEDKDGDLIARQHAYIDKLEKVIARETNIDIEVPAANRHFAYLDTMESGTGDVSDNQPSKELEQKRGDLSDKLHHLKVRLGQQPMDYKTFNDTLGMLEQLITTQQSLDIAVEALRECAEDLKAELDARYSINDGDIHPAMKSKYEREMSTVYKAKAALASIKE